MDRIKQTQTNRYRQRQTDRLKPDRQKDGLTDRHIYLDVMQADEFTQKESKRRRKTRRKTN